MKFLKTMFKTFQIVKPVGRWRVEHLSATENVANNTILRKMDLANMDSCYCNEISKCLVNDKKSH